MTQLVLAPTSPSAWNAPLLTHPAEYLFILYNPDCYILHGAYFDPQIHLATPSVFRLQPTERSTVLSE